MTLLILYLIIINALAFCFMLADKVKAKKGYWRISEATLMTLAALGGSLGAYFAMVLFRHKTKRPKFRLGLPALIALHIIAVVLIISYIKAPG